MFIGNPEVFAIESHITQQAERQSQLGLGFFVLHILGRCYGVREPDATMLGCSFREVERRIDRRGTHNAPLLMSADAGDAAFAFRTAIYGKLEATEYLLGTTSTELKEIIQSQHLQWAPDGDEAFDDGSYVLQVEDTTHVRLIAFVGRSSGRLFDPASLRDLRLPAQDFYQTLEDWREAFRERIAKFKI